MLSTLTAGINNLFKLAHKLLKWKTHRAFIDAKLEPFLGFLLGVQFGKPRFVCDFQELYRYLIDDFLIERCHTLRKKDFILVTYFMMHLKIGRRFTYASSRLTASLKT